MTAISETVKGLLDRFEAAVVRRERATTLTEKERAELDYETAISEIGRRLSRAKHVKGVAE